MRLGRQNLYVQSGKKKMMPSGDPTGRMDEAPEETELTGQERCQAAFRQRWDGEGDQRMLFVRTTQAAVLKQGRSHQAEKKWYGN